MPAAFLIFVFEINQGLKTLEFSSAYKTLELYYCIYLSSLSSVIVTHKHLFGYYGLLN